MGDLSFSEMLVIAIVAIVVIGPKELPGALASLGRWIARARGVAAQFRQGFDTMVREAELKELEKEWAAKNARIMAEHPAAEYPADAFPEGDETGAPVRETATKAAPDDAPDAAGAAQPALPLDLDGGPDIAAQGDLLSGPKPEKGPA